MSNDDNNINNNSSPLYPSGDEPMPPQINEDVDVKETSQDINTTSPADSTFSGSAAPDEDILPPQVTSEPTKKYAGGRGKFVATILGLLLLVGGSVAGLVLVRQNQNIGEKAADCIPACGPNQYCHCANGQACTYGECVDDTFADACEGDGRNWCQNSGGSGRWTCCEAGYTCGPGGVGCVPAGGGGTYQYQLCPEGTSLICPQPQYNGDVICVRYPSSCDQLFPSTWWIDEDICGPTGAGDSVHYYVCQPGCSCQPPYIAPPQNPTYSCTPTGNAVTLSWSAVPGVTHYALRVDDQANGWTGTCSTVNPGDICQDIAATSYTFNVAPGQTFIWWVHSCTPTSCSSAVGGTSFKCEVPLTPTPSPSPSPTPPPTAQCLDVKAYNTSWVQLTPTQLAQLKAGDRVRFTVAGQASSGNFTKARFTINNVLGSEVTTVKPNSNEFYYEYIIPANTTMYSIIGEIYHETLGWR